MNNNQPNSGSFGFYDIPVPKGDVSNNVYIYQQPQVGQQPQIYGTQQQSQMYQQQPQMQQPQVVQQQPQMYGIQQQPQMYGTQQQQMQQPQIIQQQPQMYGTQQMQQPQMVQPQQPQMVQQPQILGTPQHKLQQSQVGQQPQIYGTQQMQLQLNQPQIQPQMVQQQPQMYGTQQQSQMCQQQPQFQQSFQNSNNNNYNNDQNKNFKKIKCVTHKNRIAGVITTGAQPEQTSIDGFITYEIYLQDINLFLKKKQPWNRKYKAAIRIFNSLYSPALKSTLKVQHLTFYRDGSADRTQVIYLENGEDLLTLLNNGYRDDQRREYTYVIVDNVFRFVETSKVSKVKDLISKHAMHANCSQDVWYAGEFHINESDSRPGFSKLVLDNNSGTYAPDKNDLPDLERLFVHNFPDLEVQGLNYDDSRLIKMLEDLHLKNKCDLEIKKMT